MEGMEKISRSGEMEMEYSRKMKGMTGKVWRRSVKREMKAFGYSNCSCMTDVSKNT